MSLSPEGHAFTRANKKPRPQDATALPKAEVQAQPERLNCLPSPARHLKSPRPVPAGKSFPSRVTSVRPAASAVARRIITPLNRYFLANPASPITLQSASF